MDAPRKKRPQGPTSYFDENDRKAFIAQRDELGLEDADLARECNVSRAAITHLLAHPIPHAPYKEKGKYRGCRFLAKLQTALRLANTTKRRPAAVDLDRQRRAEEILRSIDSETADGWLGMGEKLTKKA